MFPIASLFPRRIRMAFLFIVLSALSLTGQNFNPQNIRIVRDSFGVPHIFAPTDAEVAYGLAWATCEDDFETLQWGLLAAKNMLGRHLGREGAEVDYAGQMLEVMKTVKARYATEVPDDFKRVMEGGVAGVNAYAEKFPEKVLVKKSFPVEPEVIIAGYMMTQALMSGVDGTLRGMLNGSYFDPDIYDAVGDEPGSNGKGSNGFVLNSKKTKDGHTYLGINPHQPLEGPVSWYEAHVCSEEGWNCAGALFHGAISIFVGSNENLGWTHTTPPDNDLIDVYQLEMHPKKKKWYKFDGEWHKLDVRKAKLGVRLSKTSKIRISIKKKYWWSEYGPTLITDKGTFAIRLGAVMTLKAAEQWYRMNKARNFTEFKQAIRFGAIARQNIMYADKYDTIYYVSQAMIPKRKPGYDYKRTVVGNTAETRWDEFYNVDELVNYLNPPSGYLFNANHASVWPTDRKLCKRVEDFAPEMGYTYKMNNRAARVFELMEEYEKVSFEEFKKIKYDYTFPDSIVFLRDFDIEYLWNATGEDHPDIAEALKAVQNWDRSCDMADTVAPLCFQVLYNMYDRGGGRNEKRFQEDPAARDTMIIQCVRDAQRHMLTHFGTLYKPLGEVQRLIRGDKDIAIEGGPDVLMTTRTSNMPDGRGKIWVGDSYVQLTRFTPEGPEIWSGMPFGASNTPGSEHYTTQMENYQAHKLKRMYLDKEEVLKRAVRVYHPE